MAPLGFVAPPRNMPQVLEAVCASIGFDAQARPSPLFFPLTHPTACALQIARVLAAMELVWVRGLARVRRPSEVR